MKRHALLLAVCVGIYVVCAGALHLTYGPSYGWLEGQNRWVPDGAGGWKEQGEPLGAMPTVSSEQVPVPLQYLPIFLPAALLALFLFTPLRRRLDRPQREPEVGGFEAVDDESGDSQA